MEDDVDIEANKTLLRRIFENVINDGRIDLADELYAEAHELHPESTEVTRGPDGMKRAFAALREQLPEVQVIMESMVAVGSSSTGEATVVPRVPVVVAGTPTTTTRTERGALTATRRRARATAACQQRAGSPAGREVRADGRDDHDADE